MTLTSTPRKDFNGKDITPATEQPDAETCCKYCRVQTGSEVWTYSTGVGDDFPKKCWCKFQIDYQKDNGELPCPQPPATTCARTSGTFAADCTPWAWLFLVLCATATTVYLALGYIANKVGLLYGCHFAVPLNHFIPGFLSYSVPVFLK